ncbi:nuclear transport factor 2 family protein [Schumannella luteola]
MGLSQSTVADLVDSYLRALSSGDVPAVLSLFAPDGMVHSPLYGELPAHEFYPVLFSDTARSVLTLRRTLQNIDAGEPTVAFWFDFAWTLADGTPAPFTVIDVAELDPDGRITRLHIVYDTHPIRAAWENQRLTVDGAPTPPE